MSRGGYGTAVALSEAFPRVMRLAGKPELDLAELTGGGIRQDLERRDFTVNSIAISLSRKEWIDPFGGVEDLARRRLRMISEENLRDDPLRTLRAARFIAALELVPDPATSAACRRTAPLLSSAAPERVRVELEKLLSCQRVVPALSWAAEADLLSSAFGRPLSVRKAGALVRRAGLDGPAVWRCEPERRLEIRLVLLSAALGLTPGESAEWLAGRRFSRATASRISRFFGLAREAGMLATADARWGWVRDAGTDGAQALRIARLLSRGRPPAALAGAARSLRTAHEPPRITGTDLLEWLRIPPGPRVGEILRQVEIEGVRGRVRTRAQAKKWLLRAHPRVERAEK